MHDPDHRVAASTGMDMLCQTVRLQMCKTSGNGSGGHELELLLRLSTCTSRNAVSKHLLSCGRENCTFRSVPLPPSSSAARWSAVKRKVTSKRVWGGAAASGSSGEFTVAVHAWEARRNDLEGSHASEAEAAHTKEVPLSLGKANALS